MASLVLQDADAASVIVIDTITIACRSTTAVTALAAATIHQRCAVALSCPAATLWIRPAVRPAERLRPGRS
jgi:hypothetical protein